jgi:hydrogenase maturation protease
MPSFKNRKSKNKILVLGMGNPILSDDGVGVHVATELEKRLQSNKNVEVKSTSLAGLNLLDLIVDYEAVIIIDALKVGGEVGDIHRLSLKDLPQLLHGASTHDISLAEAVDLGNRLYGSRMPKEIVIFGIEVTETETFSSELTLEAKKSVPKAVDLVTKEIRRIQYELNLN